MMNAKKKAALTANRILPGIQCFAWNPDRSMVAVCPQGREILIFNTNQKPNISDWSLKEVLREHYSNVNSLDWHPVTNQLLSCSTDRGIIIWSYNQEQARHMPNLCAVKELKSNLSASWNTKGDKFCVGGSSGHVFVGSYNDALNFWVALSQTEEPPLGKPLHKASVICTRFDPGSGRVVASASAIFKRQADGSWQFAGSLDPGFGKFKASRIGSEAFGGRTVFFDGLQMDEGTIVKPSDTIHQNYINDCQAYVKDGSGNVQVLTTCDPNGSINYWNVAEHL